MTTIYFDIGGVIFQDFFSGAASVFARDFGLPLQKVIDAYIATDLASYSKNQLSDQERWTLFIEKMGLPYEKVKRCIEEFYKSYKLFPQTLTFIQNLSQTHKYNLGILSDQPIGIAQYLRKKHPEVFSLFNPNLIIISAEIGKAKKDEDLGIFHEAIKRANTDPGHMLFVDNSAKNIKKAQNLGVQTFLFNSMVVPIETLLNNLQKKIETL